MSAIPESDFETSFAEWSSHFDSYRSLLRQRHKTTRPRKILARVEKFWSWLEQENILPQELSPHHFDQFAKALKNGSLCRAKDRYSNRWMTVFLNHARAWSAHLKRSGVLLADPFEGRRSRLPVPACRSRALTTEEVSVILKAPDLSTPWGVRNQAMWEVLYGSGLRVGELTSLTLESLDLKERFLNLRNTKNGWDRSAPLTRAACRSIQRYLEEGYPSLHGPRAGNALWVSYRHIPLTKDAVTRLASKYSERTGVKFTPHDLRRACATHLLEGGANIRQIAKLLGHEDLATTSYYAKARLLELQKVHRRTHPRESTSTQLEVL